MTPTRWLLAATALAALPVSTTVPAGVPVAAVARAPRPAPYVSAPMTAEPLLLPPPVAAETEPAPRVYSPVRAAPAAMFRTPEDAMRYLVTAYNHHDLAALRHVTTPSARDALEAMRAQATDLRLKACTFDKFAGDYECTFSHGFPASMHRTDRGSASFTVGPAAKPGWYMTVLESCGG